MSIIMQQFDFTKQMISATSKHITLQTGDKVIWRKTNRRMYGVSFDIRCAVVKPGAKTVKVLCRWKGRNTGEIRTEERSVPIRSLFRHDWQEVPQAVNEKIQATVLATVRSELQHMDDDLATIRQQPAASPAWYALVEDELVGHEFSTAPYRY